MPSRRRSAETPASSRLRWWIGWAMIVLGGPICVPAATPRNEAAVAAVERGETTRAYADAWGFDPEDATEAVQSAIRSRAGTVVIPYTGTPWILRPVTLRSDLELILEPGVVVLAKAGEFRGGGDSLFRATDVTNLSVRGSGAVVRMRKADYQQPPYPKAEWRMGLSLVGCRNVLVDGLRIESTGGDGIYIGSSRSNRWCENIVIRNVTCHDNHRQGISVISAVHLLIENCTLSGTRGTPPEAGIDFEPDEPDERLVDCVVRNCVIANNAGNGVLVWLKPLTAASHPVSLRFENCHVQMGEPGNPHSSIAPDLDLGWSGYAVGEVADQGPAGTVEFVRCTSENTGREAVRLVNKSARGAHVRFVDCRWKGSWRARHRNYGGPRSPILIRSHAPDRCREPGGVEFVECTLVDDIDAPVVRWEDDDDSATLRQVSGRLHVVGIDKPRLRLGKASIDITLQLAEPVGKR
ncbi:MAG: right-handed parallel beta-helix repeat-containing protein [Verrucomicrobiales bacterium]|nr:right-handed parallel beta-helix repeat-containing protein [Verrucomicrobiales bacterium]